MEIDLSLIRMSLMATWVPGIYCCRYYGDRFGVCRQVPGIFEECC